MCISHSMCTHRHYMLFGFVNYWGGEPSSSTALPAHEAAQFDAPLDGHVPA